MHEAIDGLLLYGSRARGDHRPQSDVDLLGVVAGATTAAGTTRLGNVVLSTYPRSQLLRHARLGDLFVLHLVTEGQTLFDRCGVFEEMRDAFVRRANYDREIAMACDVGWFLVDCGDMLPPTLRAERMAWCVRTMLIGRAAAAGRPVFATAALVELAGSDDVALIIDDRERCSIVDAASRLPKLLEHVGTGRPVACRTVATWEGHFDAQRNTVGAGLVRALSGRAPRRST